MRRLVAVVMAVVLLLALSGSALAAKGGSGVGSHTGSGGGKHGGGGTACTLNAPSVKVDNTYGWAQWGSWGLPGQPLTYAINVINYDVGCKSSTFVVTAEVPTGFVVSMPAGTIGLASGASAYVYATVTSPAAVTDGDYGLTVIATRAGQSDTSASFTTYYKVYSSDSIAPTLFWPNPGDGTTITGKSYDFVVSSNDDHGLRNIDLYIDGTLVAATNCDDISYTCSLYSNQPVRQGQHSAIFEAYDWLGNNATLPVSFAVG